MSDNQKIKNTMNFQIKIPKLKQRIVNKDHDQTWNKSILIKSNFNMSLSISDDIFPQPKTDQNDLQSKAMTIYQQYLRLFEINQQLNQKMIKQVQERNKYACQYKYQKAYENEEIVRRKRRNAQQIKRLFYCPFNKCKKQYGTEGSLTHHVRLKHIQFYNSGKFQLFLENYIKKSNLYQKQIEPSTKKMISQIKAIKQNDAQLQDQIQ